MHLEVVAQNSSIKKVFLKVVSATFLQGYFICLIENTYKTRKIFFYFTLKALFILEIIKFYFFRYSNFMTSSYAKAWNTKHILLNNLGSKQSGNEIWPVYVILQKKIFYQKFFEKCGLDTSPRLFLIFKESSVKRNPRRLVY